MSDLGNFSKALEERGVTRRKIFDACMKAMAILDKEHPLNEKALTAYELFQEFTNYQTRLANGNIPTLEQVDLYTKHDAKIRQIINSLFDGGVDGS